MATVADRLDELVDVSRVWLVDATRARHAVVSAAVRPRAVDTTLQELGRLGVPDADITLTRAEVVGSPATGPAALGVLGTNVSMMVVGAVATLTLQSLLMRRAVARRRSGP